MTEAADGAGLSKRELEVCRLVAEGMTNHQIGRLLGISQRTVETYLRRIFSKTGIRSRAQIGMLLGTIERRSAVPMDEVGGD